LGEGEERSRSAMKTYEIEFRPRAKKQLMQLEAADKRRIQGAIELLKTDPVPPSAKRLKGRNDYSLRVGNYRVIYNFATGKLKILVIGIGHRREVYLKND
jgi:mRNA interferase RelE/StbE